MHLDEESDASTAVFDDEPPESLCRTSFNCTSTFLAPAQRSGDKQETSDGRSSSQGKSCNEAYGCYRRQEGSRQRILRAGLTSSFFFYHFVKTLRGPAVNPLKRQNRYFDWKPVLQARSVYRPTCCLSCCATNKVSLGTIVFFANR